MAAIIIGIEIFQIGFGFLLFTLLFFRSKEALTFKLFAVQVFSLTILAATQLLIRTEYMLQMPYFFRISDPFSYLVPVSNYLFYRMVLMNEYKFRKWDWLFVLPFAFHFVELIPYYFSPTAIKMADLNFIFSGSNIDESQIKLNQLKEGFLLTGIQLILKAFFATVMFALTMILYFKHIKTFNKTIIKDNKLIFNLLGSLLWFRIISIFVIIIIALIWSNNSNVTVVLTEVVVFVTLSYPVFYIFRYPLLLFGMNITGATDRKVFVNFKDSIDLIHDDVSNTDIADSVEHDQPVLDQNAAPSEKSVRRMLRIETFLLYEKPFLKDDFCLSQLALKIGIPERVISSTIKEVHGQNFNNYTNSMRILYMIDQLKTSHKWRAYSIESISFMLGFNSQNTFYIAFKRYMGMTPKAYIDSLPAIV
ncbi:MAG: helix-turn-helix transcriptional regulator [Bacteroidetes bacterium]|nr:helix-turn-helix transcriptional regulator [Bacteroidota bacterium]